MGMSKSKGNTHNIFLLCNYILLGSASSCIFLTISLRLFPSLSGLSLIFLHALTIATAVSGCSIFASSTTATTSDRLYGSHMVATVLTAIFQGAVSVLTFTRTGEFLRFLNSYVLEEDGAVILKLAGGLCVVMFCLEWVVLVLAFLLKYSDYLDDDDDDDDFKVRKQDDDGLKDWPSYPFQFKN
ncbi:hypothetical protein CARUB_v10005835mg [Capsella rubella]|uniref:Transmembrane protein n=1 Tax=Capsella rubella TaxID=81985 RepID=R0F6R8_9BRAS|nr:uncharacterized protein LOC17879588 [Capsella rubella]EOA17502.1 hypothetical protein CARUB_v10005835mg [Capsella rubella]